MLELRWLEKETVRENQFSPNEIDTKTVLQYRVADGIYIKKGDGSGCIDSEALWSAWKDVHTVVEGE